MGQVIVWSGWLGGVAVGLYTLLQFAVSGKALGASTGFGNVCGLVTRREFFHTGVYGEDGAWRLWFTLGIPLGGLIALLTSPGASLHASFDMGAMYERVLPSALHVRGPVLVLGGVLIGYGARLAGGCTSGHSIAGLSLLNPPSLVASAGFFAGGILVVQVLFRVVG